MKKNILLLSAIVILITSFFWPTMFEAPTDIPTPGRGSTFTWIGTNVTEDLAYWANYLKFTNVVVRYVTTEEAEASFNTLGKYGITFWRQVPGNLQGVPDNTVEGYKNRLANEILQSPSNKIYLDDCDATYGIQGAQAFNNMLEAIRQIQNDNIILVFYYTNLTPHYGGLAWFAAQVDLTDFDVDIYFPPRFYPTTLPVTKSLGIYLWCWTGSGEYKTIGDNWNTITEGMVSSTFSKAQQADVERMATWMGYEKEVHETGMFDASLYLHPEWWDLITQLNKDFLGEQT